MGRPDAQQHQALRRYRARRLRVQRPDRPERNLRRRIIHHR